MMTATQHIYNDNGNAPQLTIIHNRDLSKRALYRLARIIYAETRAESLVAVEALASMISNLHKKSGRSLSEISEDKTIFDSLNKDSARHGDLLIRHDANALQMCLRVMSRALSGILPDAVRGATRFHREELLPDWATSIGSVAEIGNLHFYI